MLGLIGIGIAIVLIIALSINGLNVIVSSILASIVVILFNRGAILTNMIGESNSYLFGLTNFLQNYFPLFLLSSILAKYIYYSGAAESIANKIIEKIGIQNPYRIFLALYLISALLTLGGISIFVVFFVVLPLAKPIFKKADINWSLVPLPVILGGATFTMTMLPGNPSIQNNIPIYYLETELTAEPILGIIGSVVCVIFSILFMKYELNKSILNREGFKNSEKRDTYILSMKKKPSFLISILPLIMMVILSFVGSFYNFENTTILSLVIAIVLSVVLFYKYVENNKETINKGVIDAIIPAFITASTMAFGVIIVEANSFKYIFNAVMSIPGSPLISLSLSSAIFGGITASSSSSIGIVLSTFGSNYIEMGVTPELLHRVTVMSSAIFANMPHCGVVITIMSLSGLNYKNSYRHIVLGFTLAHFIAVFTIILIALLFL